MNALEAEYSFLAPTWKLPTVATPSMYSRTHGVSYPSETNDSGPDWALWNNTMHNSRYIPTTTGHLNYPISTYNQRIGPPVIYSQQQPNYQINGDHPPYYEQTNNQYESYNNIPNYGQSHPQTINRGMTYSVNGQRHPAPPGQKRRVKIIDHSRQALSTAGTGFISDRTGYNSTNEQPYSTSDLNKSQQKSRQSVSNQNRVENRFGYTGNNFNIHDYLYGQSQPGPGSYTDAFKNHQRRLQEEKLGRKSVIHEYKTFAQNGGLGPAFLNTDQRTYEEKINSEKKKQTYSKVVRETNQSRIEERKRVQNNHGQEKNRTVTVPKYQRRDTTKSHFSSMQEAREYADKIEKPHNLKPVFQTEFSTQIPLIAPILITSLSNNQRRSSFDSVLSNLSSNEFTINQSRRSSSSLSSIRTKRRVRFHSRVFIRRRSSTFIDLPSHIIGKSIPVRTDSLSARYHREKSASKILDKKPNFEHFQNSSNKNEKKFINSHSMMMTKNMRLPPTATIVINQTYKPSILTTTSTNNRLKKTTSNKNITPSQRPLTARSIPVPFRKSTTISKPDFDLKIKSLHHTDDENNSSNE